MSTLESKGQLPLPHHQILSIALSADSKTSYFIYNSSEKLHESRIAEYDIDGITDVVSVCASSSEEIVKLTIDTIIELCPDFVSIHNGFNFDLGHMAAHAPKEHAWRFKSVQLGMVDKGTDIYIEGVTFVHTLAHLNKVSKSEHPNVPLKALSEQYKLGTKLAMSDMMVNTITAENYEESLMYNVTDAILHRKLALISGVILDTASCASIMSCSIGDVTKYITGVMMSSMVCRYCLVRNINIPWSTISLMKKKYSGSEYTGAMVIDPEKGYSEGVVVYDFASMYPSLMIDTNISFDTTTSYSSIDDAIDKFVSEYSVEIGNIEDIRVTLKSDKPYITKDAIISHNSIDWCIIDKREPSIIKSCLLHLKSLRLEYGKKSSMGAACKIAMVSVYGTMGSRVGTLSSIPAAAMVTYMGRYLLSQVVVTFNSLGCDILYGDTDSVFISTGKQGKERQNLMQVCENRFRQVLDDNYMHVSDLELEYTIDRVVLLGRKMYYGVVYEDATGTSRNERIIMKGIASVRRDRLGIVRNSVADLLNSICNTRRNVAECTRCIERIVHNCSNVVQGLYECSSVKKISGVRFCSYTDVKGNERLLDIDTKVTSIGIMLHVNESKCTRNKYGRFCLSSIELFLKIGWGLYNKASQIMHNRVHNRIRRMPQLMLSAMFHKTPRSPQRIANQ